MSIAIHLSGAAIGELSALSQQVLQSAGHAEPTTIQKPPSEVPERGDPIAVAALVLAIPGAIIATLDLIARAKLADHVARLLDKAHKVEGSVTLWVGSATPLDLARASVDEVMDRLSEDGDH